MFALIFHACVGRSGSIEGLLFWDSETSESVFYPMLLYWIHQFWPIPTRLKDCWLGRKEPRQANEKPNAAILTYQAQLTNSC